MIEKIRSQVSNLYPSDIELANKFIDQRDIHKLKDLVDSSIIILEKDLSRLKPKDESLKLSVGKITKLKTEIDTYLQSIDPEYFEDEGDFYNDLY